MVTKSVLLWMVVLSEVSTTFGSMVTVGGVAQWLARRSLAGGLSLIYGWHVTTTWVKRLLWVNLPGQLSLPSGIGKWVVIHVINYMDYGGEHR